MSVEIEKKIAILIVFEVSTFRWFLTIGLEGVRTVYKLDSTVEINAEGARKILNDLSYTMTSYSDKVEFVIE